MTGTALSLFAGGVNVLCSSFVASVQKLPLLPEPYCTKWLGVPAQQRFFTSTNPRRSVTFAREGCRAGTP